MEGLYFLRFSVHKFLFKITPLSFSSWTMAISVSEQHLFRIPYFLNIFLQGFVFAGFYIVAFISLD